MNMCGKLLPQLICLMHIVHSVLTSDQDLPAKLIYVTVKIGFLTKLETETKHYQVSSLRELSNNMFNDTITEIIINKQNVPILKQGDLPFTPKIFSLELEANNIEEIEPGAFQNNAGVHIIVLKNNLLKEIEDGVFTNLGELRELQLMHNSISRISQHAFDNLTNLREIYLYKNHLTLWDNNWFTNTPKLIQLDLSYNLIEEIPNEAFAKNNRGWESMYLTFNGNQIRKVGSDIFKGIKSVDLFSVNDNQISDIDVNAFRGTNAIRYIKLRGNLLERFDYNLFPPNFTIIYLDLRHNKIHECFENFNKTFMAECIRLDSNPLDCNCVEKISNWTKTQNLIRSEDLRTPYHPSPWIYSNVFSSGCPDSSVSGRQSCAENSRTQNPYILAMFD